MELAYQRVPGVLETAVGYTDGHKPNPTYREVCSGTTGHTEAVQIKFDPRVGKPDANEVRRPCPAGPRRSTCSAEALTRGG